MTLSQLSQVKQAYAADPTNAELITLKEELESLIKLTLEYLEASEGASSSKPATASTSAGPSKTEQKRKQAATAQGSSSTAAATSFKPGDECLARYSGDGKMYPARITSVGGSSEKAVYSVIFKGYDSTELLSISDLKPLTIDKKRQLELQAEDEEKAKKKAKNAKKEANRQQKNAEQVGKQQAWQSFAKKSGKKVNIPGVSGQSMFKTPEDPYGKVGVVGAGRGMSAAKKVGRHVFDDGE